MNSEITIKIENLSKRYRIGLKERKHDTIVSYLISRINAPLSNLKQLRKLSKFNKNEEGEDIIWALKDVSFVVKKGEVLGIIGPNGAGKSTLLKILSRITKPTSGRAIINGRISSLLEVGTGFHPDLTGRENIYLNGTVLGMSKDEIDQKFDEIVEFSEIEKFLDTPVKRFSSGMSVRLAFAVAAHLEPEILVVDEVLAVGDAAFQKKCLGKMKDVSSKGRTVLFVSHNMAAIQTLCSRAIFLRGGIIESMGDVDDTIRKYLEDNSVNNNENIDFDLFKLSRSGNLKKIFIKGFINGRPLVGSHCFEPRQLFEFKFDLHIPENMKQCTLGIHFINELGVTVYTNNTRFFLKKINLRRGEYKITCRIPKFPLVAGNYYLSFGFSSDNRQIDWLDKITQIEISKMDIYGTGELPWKSQGFFLPESEWTIDEN